jgi:hypothetical protein
MLGFKSFRSASTVLAGIELMHMIHKGQFSPVALCSWQSSFMRWQGKSILCEPGTCSAGMTRVRLNNATEPKTLNQSLIFFAYGYLTNS